MMLPSHECAHLPCHCGIPAGHTYCCDHCSTQAALGQAQQACECEHAGCRTVPASAVPRRRSGVGPQLRRG